MLAILLVGFIGLAWLGIWLKRRHRKKVEERRAASSGFPSASEKRDGARAATPDLWGPHQVSASPERELSQLTYRSICTIPKAGSINPMKIWSEPAQVVLPTGEG